MKPGAEMSVEYPDEAIGSTMKTGAEIAVECLTKPNDKQCRGAKAGPRLIAG